MVDNNGSSAEQIKRSVKEKYAKIAVQPKSGGCCGTGSSCSGEDEIDYSIFADDYSDLHGYNPDADLGLGCGLPTEYARMKAGDTVVDLGSGAGNDAFVARQVVGDSGRVIGIDMTEDDD
jgi:arsenite methyltransferase